MSTVENNAAKLVFVRHIFGLREGLREFFPDPVKPTLRINEYFKTPAVRFYADGMDVISSTLTIGYEV